MQFRLGGSPRLATALILVHALGAGSLWMVVPGLPGAALAGLCLALGVVVARDRALLRAAGSVRELSIGEAGQVSLGLRDGRRVEGVAGARRHVSRFWVAFPIGGTMGRSLFIAADMLPPQAFRRLKLWALWDETARAAIDDRSGLRATRVAGAQRTA